MSFSSKSYAKTSPHIFGTFDGLRGIAAILVLIRHLGPFFGKKMEFQESFLAVDVFFILSGAVLSHAYERRLQSGLSAMHFIYIRIVRLYPLYILGTVLALFVAISAISDGSVPAPWLAWYFFLSLLMLPNVFVREDIGESVFPLNEPAWSLFFEVAANVFYAVFIRLLTSRALIAILLVSALGLIACLYISPNHDLDIGWKIKTLPGGVVRVGYSFFAGVFLYRVYRSKGSPSLTGRYAAVMPYAILLLATLCLTASPSPAFRPYFESLAVMVVFPALIYVGLFFQPSGIGAGICKFLGLISYAVYVMQRPLVSLIQRVSSAIHDTPYQFGSWTGLEFMADYAPYAGLAFLAVLLPFCWWLDKVYDGPVRRRLLALWSSAPAKINIQPG